MSVELCESLTLTKSGLETHLYLPTILNNSKDDMAAPADLNYGLLSVSFTAALLQ